MSAPTADNVTGPFVPCLNPATLSGIPLEQFLALATGAGFPTVEVSIQQAQAHGTAQVRDVIQEFGVNVAAASGILPAGPVLPAPLLVDPDTYRACLDGLDERLEAMAALDCTIATTVLNPRSPLQTAEARAVARERIAQLATTAAAHGVRLAVETVSIHTGLPPELDGPHPVIDTLPQLAELLDDTGTDGAGVLVDSFHWAAAGADPTHITDLGPHRITHVQIADIPHGRATDELTDSQRLFPGDGALDWTSIADALTQAGYAGPVSVELFNPKLRALPAGDIARLSHHAATRCWTLAEATR
ncbi:sugar phosphate isomerase/epimerase family protein [Streptomyces chiangmaiensis]|uniref:Sugar phosphate isomerase/epimerase family protein n=1 Tax=Streptomyces chiangmaiensis TaxID=766497 RepID=A0ABU7FNL9_9ACTN|nr:sugar phosphate isomerase/epimerase family protein [Streptomyces chiangmaiensis]MED7825687.1 sugar phosphate isomerase/epimerase family protein [Streptomyces chiangmaiensis]